MKHKLAENLKRVRKRMAEACDRAQRGPGGVTLVAVTKYVTPQIIHELIGLGLTDLGESRVQGLTQRAVDVLEWVHHEAQGGVRPLVLPKWHLVGHLQRNKVKTVLPFVDLIHSVDTLRLAEEIDQQSRKLGRRTPVLLEVNTADDPVKQGCAVAAATHLVEQVATLPGVELRGLMAMAPLTDDTTTIRCVFERTRELFDEIVGLRIGGPAFTELSMGMSNDFEFAIECGATYVRIGAALFDGIELPTEAVPVD